MQFSWEPNNEFLVEHSINSILSKMNSSSNLKIEDFKLEQKKSVEIKIHRETTPEK